MSGDTTYQALERLSHLPSRSGNQGDRVAGQYYYDVELTGGSISNVTLTDVTINGVTTARHERTVTTAGTVTVASDDYVITINKTVPQITTVTLPASPTTSRSLIIKDGAGNAGDFPITLDGNGKNLDNLTTYVLSADWNCVEVIFNGTEWNVLNAYKADGDVVGPNASTDNAITRFDGITGRVIQDSSVIISDLGAVSGASSVTTSGQFTSQVVTGTAPLVVASTTRVTNLNAATSGNADTATALATPRTIGAVSFNGTADIVPQTIQIVDAGGDTTTFPMLSGAATGSLQPNTDTGLTYNATTKNLATTTFTGAFSGTATTATNVTVVNEATDTTCFPVFVTAATGDLPPKSNSGLSFNSNTATLAATNLAAALGGSTGLPLTTGVTGTLPVANGGTGDNTYTDGQLLIGNTSGNTLTKSTLTQGSGITITNGNGSITIAATGGSPLSLLATATASNSTSLDFTSVIGSAYSEYIFVMAGVVPASDSIINILTSSNNGSSYDNGSNNYSYVSMTNTPSGGYGIVSSTGATLVKLSPFALSSVATDGGISGSVRMTDPSNATKNKMFDWDHAYYQSGSTDYSRGLGMGVRLATSAVNAVRFIMTAGNITSGSIYLYGVKNT